LAPQDSDESALYSDLQFQFAGCCRLDNRQALQERLDLAGQEGLSDAQLVLAAYRRHGLDGVQHLVGDWSFALWDLARQRLVLARDATGNSAMFWWQGAGLILFANNLGNLLAAPPVPRRPNPEWIAGLLTIFHDPRRQEETAFEGVSSLRPGYMLVVEGGQATMHRWWRPEQLAALDGQGRDEWGERFVSLYDDAVRQRLRRAAGSVALTLSGGLDSGSVAALAAPALAQQNELLTGYVHVPRFTPAEHPGRISNEWNLATATAKHVGNIRPVECISAGISPVEGIRRMLDIMHVPSHAACNWFWILDILERARDDGASVLLTGQGGNATVSYQGNGSLWPQWRALQWRAMVHELTKERGGWTVGVRERLLKPALRPAWRWFRDARPLSHGLQPWSRHAVINPQWAREIGLADSMRRSRHDPSLRHVRPQAVKNWRLGQHHGTTIAGAMWSQLGIAFGLDVRDPTRDQRLVELCWRLPDDMFWAHGLRRGLIRHEMRHHLPEEVIGVTRKGLQASDLPERLKACREQLFDELASVSTHPLVRAWLDVSRLTQSVQAAVSDDSHLPGNAVSPDQMLRALAIAMFIVRNG
jgi:asparagine synthase (glutamine-hydrolysing)